MDKEKKEIRNATVHSMKRRSMIHDYCRTGYYHVTISVVHELGQLLGGIAGRVDRPEGDAEAPHVVLTAIGRMVQEELTHSITRHYPMLEVLEYVVMPEHLHVLLRAHSAIVSRNGRPTHLGQVMAGFKYGCNRRYWALTGRIALAAEPPGAVKAQGAVRAGTAGATVLGGSAAKGDPAAGKLPPLFEEGYVDVMPIDEAQLETQRQYIRNNPRNRLLRVTNRAQLQLQHRSVETALKVTALKGYLSRECHPSQMDDEQWRNVYERLLAEDGMIWCDSYGPRKLLTQQLLPVVCHRKDASRFQQQKEACLQAAAAGAVLVSPRIAKGEQTIIDEAIARGYAVVMIVDNGFTERYHASEERMTLCIDERLLLVSPWRYHYRKADEGISVAECKAMNCVAQALCRTRDDWWKDSPGG